MPLRPRIGWIRRWFARIEIACSARFVTPARNARFGFGESRSSASVEVSCVSVDGNVFGPDVMRGAKDGVAEVAVCFVHATIDVIGRHYAHNRDAVGVAIGYKSPTTIPHPLRYASLPTV